MLLLWFIVSVMLSDVENSQLVSSNVNNCHNGLYRKIVITNSVAGSSTDIQQTKLTFHFGTTHLFYCFHKNCNVSVDSKINWVIPNKVPLVTNGDTKFGAHLSRNLTVLTLKYIQESYRGTYRCFMSSNGEICHAINFLVVVSDQRRLSIKQRLLIGLISCVFTVLLLFLGRKVYFVYYSKQKPFIMPTENTEVQRYWKSSLQKWNVFIIKCKVKIIGGFLAVRLLRQFNWNKQSDLHVTSVQWNTLYVNHDLLSQRVCRFSRKTLGSNWTRLWHHRMRHNAVFVTWLNTTGATYAYPSGVSDLRLLVGFVVLKLSFLM